MAKRTKKEEKFYPAEEQGITKRKTAEQIEQEIDVGEADEDVYSEEGLEKLEENDELEPWEEGFMAGAKDIGQLGKDAFTGEPLINEKKIVELRIKGQLYRFANEKNAKQYQEKLKEKIKKKKD